MNHQFLDNPDFLEYVRLLKTLHDAIREGRDESDEGEAIREQMDGPGSRLSPAEIACVNGISADFYSLTEKPAASVPERGAGIQQDLAAASRRRDSGDYQAALDLLRQRAEFIEPAELAYQRGLIWEKAGEPEIAALFLRRAEELDPNSSRGDLTVSSQRPAWSPKDHRS
jgi:hypothetical protein